MTEQEIEKVLIESGGCSAVSQVTIQAGAAKICDVCEGDGIEPETRGQWEESNCGKCNGEGRVFDGEPASIPVYLVDFKKLAKAVFLASPKES